MLVRYIKVYQYICVVRYVFLDRAERVGPAGADDRAGHPRRVVGPAEAAVGAREDDPAVALRSIPQEADGVVGGLARRAALADADAGGAGHRDLEDGLAYAGRAGGGLLIV